MKQKQKTKQIRILKSKKTKQKQIRILKSEKKIVQIYKCKSKNKVINRI